MQKIFLYLAILLSLVMTACSPKKASSLSQSPAEIIDERDYAPTEKSLLWRISGNGLKAPSYLYGTIHMINTKDFFLTDSTMFAFKSAEKLVMEVDMKEMGDMSVMMSLMTKVMMNDGVTLPDLLTEEEYKAVEKHFADKGLPMMMLNRIKPFFLTMMTSEDFDMGGFANPDGTGNSDMMSYEMEFLDMSTDEEMETGGLETIAYQMGIFDSIPYKEQAQMLVESLNPNATASTAGISELEQLTALYKTQDIVSMVDAFKGEESGLGKYINVILNDRNANWIPVIDKMAHEKSTFFAVGAGHLAGEKGVIALLRKQGFQLTPMTSTKYVKRKKLTKL